MCLSTVYKTEKRPENEVMKNVMLIECKEGVVTLTDIMANEVSIEGEIASADLTGGTVVVRPRAQA